MSNTRYDTNVDDMDYFTFCAQTTFGDVLENPGIPDVVEKAVEENPEMDDPDFDPMGEDLYDVIDEHEAPPPPDPHPEARNVRVMRAPKAPSQAEIDAHNVSHCPFRSWCKWCVAGQPVAKGHYQSHSDEEEGRVPTVSLDYMFMKDNEHEQEEQDDGHEEENESRSGMPILVMVDHVTDMMLSSVVPKKGVNPYVVMRVSNDLSLLGHVKLVLKSDNEASILSLKQAVRA